jgi:hypothetical protein
MGTEDGDELVLFQDVRIIGSSARALLCRIGARSVWLPRHHITGKLWCAGDRGKLFIRRWVARDRQLIEPLGGSSPALIAPPFLPAPLHLVRSVGAHAPCEAGPDARASGRPDPSQVRRHLRQVDPCR